MMTCPHVNSEIIKVVNTTSPVMDSKRASTVNFTAITTSNVTASNPDDMTYFNPTNAHGQNYTDSKLRNPAHPFFHDDSCCLPMAYHNAKDKTF